MGRVRPRSLGAGLLLASAVAWPSVAADGLHLEPRIGASKGRHSVELPLEVRYRYERWKAFAPSWDGFHAFRTRFGLDYRYGERFRLFAQGQQVSVLGLGSDASGAGALYRSRTRGAAESTATGLRPSQLFAQLDPLPDAWIRVGREFVDLGTLIRYEEPDWTFLKRKRLSQRLLGSVGWTHSARAYDGVSGHLQRRGHALHAFALQPTTGVFEIENALEPQRDVFVGGLEWTALRGTWLDDTELGAFFLAYLDDRNPDRVAGLFGEIELYTLGLSWLGVYDVGPGRLDVVLWGALQLGDYVDTGPTRGPRSRNQRAGALVAELGYQLPDVWANPWLRLGVNYGSGDDDRDDGTRTTFFNVLPTNHLYYGYLDQLALQNLVDFLVQLRLAPLPKLSLDLTYHRFWLAERKDFRWAGTGAFSRENLGYARFPSHGSRDVGHELDLSVALPLHRLLAVSAGYSRLWGGRVLGDDADWLYTQVQLSY